jgi:hypothetical protein
MAIIYRVTVEVHAAIVRGVVDSKAIGRRGVKRANNTLQCNNMGIRS